MGDHRHRYELHERMGAGEQGEVWRARALDSGSDVIIKLGPESVVGAEYDLFRRLRHPSWANAVGCHPWDEQQWALVFAHRPGRPLLEAKVSLSHFADLASALAVLHRLGHSHGDLKPEHIWIPDDGPAYLFDLGFAHPGQRSGRSGTPRWMAPETIHHAYRGPSADVFSLAACAAAALGVPWPVFKERGAIQKDDWAAWLSRHVAEIGDELLTAALRWEPDERPTADELARAWGSQTFETPDVYESVRAQIVGSPVGARVSIVGGDKGSRHALLSGVSEDFERAGGISLGGIAIDLWGTLLRQASLMSQQRAPVEGSMQQQRAWFWRAVGELGENVLIGLGEFDATTRFLVRDAPSYVRICVCSEESIANFDAHQLPNISSTETARLLSRLTGSSHWEQSQWSAIAEKVTAGSWENIQWLATGIVRGYVTDALLQKAPAAQILETILEKHRESGGGLKRWYFGHGWYDVLTKPVQTRSSGELHTPTQIQRALDESPKDIELRVRLARSLNEIGELSGALAAFGEVPLAQSDLAILRDYVEVCLKLGEYKRARELLESRADLDESTQTLLGEVWLLSGVYEELDAFVPAKSSPRIEVAWQKFQAISAIYRGELGGGLKLAETALAAAKNLGDSELIASCYTAYGIALHRAGRLDEAKLAYTASLENYRRLGNFWREAAALLNLGTVNQDLGAWETALNYYQESLQTARRQGLERDAVRVSYNLANLYVWIGGISEATSLIDDAWARAKALGMRTEADFLRALGWEAANLNEDFVNAATYVADVATRAPIGAATFDTELQRAALAALEHNYASARQVLEGLPEQDAVRLLRSEIELTDPDGNVTRAEEELSVLRREVTAGPFVWKVWAWSSLAAEQRGDGREAITAAQRSNAAFESFLRRMPPRFRDAYRALPSVERLRARLTTTRVPQGEQHHWRRLLSINERLSRPERMDELLRFIMDEAIEATSAQRGLLLLHEDGNTRVELSRQFQRKALDSEEVGFSRSIAEEVMQTGAPLLTLDAIDDDRFRDNRSVAAFHLRSVACVPLAIDGACEGAIYLDHRYRTSVFADETIQWLSAFADQVSIALRHMRLLESLREKSLALEAANVELKSENVSLEEEKKSKEDELKFTKQQLRAERDVSKEFVDIVGQSPAILDALQLVKRLAPTHVSVFIHGESGTGKELIARALHQHSERHEKAFIAINCAALPENLLEAELFGAKRGAYTGADQDREGLFRLADGGTLFLDEIGDMPLTMQAKLLRVLEDGEFRPLGGGDTESADVRIVSASNKSLEQLVQQGSFREDLFYRLHTAQVQLPPLRERTVDIPLLVEFFMERLSADYDGSKKVIESDALKILAQYGWPGNIRQLQNEIRRAWALSDDTIRVGHLSTDVTRSGKVMKGGAATYKDALRDFERDLLTRAMEGAGHDVAVAAKALGMSRSLLYAKLEKLGMKWDRQRAPKRRRAKTSS